MREIVRNPDLYNIKNNTREKNCVILVSQVHLKFFLIIKDILRKL